MPPSRHSSSSHSSRPSSSRSSSSRSSGGYSRAPSSHSGSSHSSGSGFSSSRSPLFGAPYRGPSGHASSTHGGGAAPARKQSDWRPRLNQPTGFVAATRMRPTYYTGVRHSYAYYPQSWTDAETGAHFEKGYYDETGRRCDSVAFAENGRYRGVVCHCPYCEQDALLDLNVGEEASFALTCRNCGGPLEIRSELDAILNRQTGNTHVYNSEESLKKAFPQKKKRRVWPVIAAVLLALGIFGNTLEKKTQTPSGGEIQSISIVENDSAAALGSTVFLEKAGPVSYHIVTDVIRADKILVFDRSADSYYDEASGCWLWYNTDVSPAVWQYWYEGVSSDYGDYGWMEHEASGWYIEEAAGEWVALPSRYDTSALWYIG